MKSQKPFHRGQIIAAATEVQSVEETNKNIHQRPILEQQQAEQEHLQEEFRHRLTKLLLRNTTLSLPTINGSAAASVPMPYHIHLLLLPTNLIELDGLTIMELIYNAFIEGFDLTDDIVLVEFEHAVNNPHNQHCVSITYENAWRCQIRFNDNALQVQREVRRWSQRYAMEIPISERNRIATCTRRLDITTDPDPQRDYFDDFIALIDHLRLTLAPCYIFDRRQNEFLI